MKFFLLAAAFLFFVGAKGQSKDPQLDQRLANYLAYNKVLDFEKVMDFMHPRLFTVAPRETIVQAMQSAFTNKDMQFRFDSMGIVSTGPSVAIGNSAYRKIVYFMRMTITLSDSIKLSQERVATAMKQSFVTAFPGKKITIDAPANAITVAGSEVMFAIRDKGAADWMFLGVDRSNPQLVKRLYPAAVRQHFKIL